MKLKLQLVSLMLLAVLSTVQAEEGVPQAQSGTPVSQSSTPLSATEQPQPDANGFYKGATVYVSENASVWKRNGPGVNYGILAAKHVGDPLTFIRYSESGKFVEISDGDGRGWMQVKDVQAEPCGKALIDLMQEKINELEHRLSNYDSELNRQYQASQKRLEKLETENKGMKKAIEEKDLTIQQLDKQRRNYEDRLQTKELDMQMRWWVQGALIALGGAVIGIVFIFIPSPRRSRKTDHRF